MDRCVVHSSTFAQNNYAMICGLLTLEILAEENLLQKATDMGAILAARLSALKDKHEWIKDVRHKGLMFGIELGRPDSLKKKMTWDTVHKIDKGLFAELIVMPLLSRHRILTQVSGHHQDIVKLLPPLILTETHINHFVESLDSVLEDCGKLSGPLFKMATNLARHVVSK